MTTILEPTGRAAGLTLRELARACRGSTRLRNSLEVAELSGTLPFQTVAEYLASPAPMESMRKNVRSMGSRTALELDRLVRDLAATGHDETLGPALPGGEGTSARVGIFLDLEESFEAMLAMIRPQDAGVIRRRFGFGGGQGETLEEIGASLRVTRERVRQLEKRGLTDLRGVAGRFDLRASLDARWPAAWQALADGDDLVTDHEFATFRRTLPGSIELALELLGLALSDWLSEVSHRFPHGWLAPHRDRGPVDEVIVAIDDLPRDRPLPRAVRELRLPGSASDIEAALLVGRGHRILHDYLVEGRVGTRRRRSLVAHSILSRARSPLQLADLLQAYRETNPVDWCSSRDLTIVMSDAPHLFLEVSEGRWFALGAGGQVPPGGRRREADTTDEVLPEPDVTVASAIRDELERGGPQPLSALMASPRKYLPRDRSHNSVQPTLYTRSDLFVRLLPNVYGLWSQVPGWEAVMSGDVPYLLDEWQARVFAMARRAGEPWGAFPLWSPEAEYRLCRWAIRDGSPEVRRSLLAMAAVDIWPLEAEERARWRRVCARDGRYDLFAMLRANVFSVRPDLDRVLAALIDLGTAGTTSWMALNRVDGRQVDSQLGCSLLAVLILCGAAIAPAGDDGCAWQLPHAINGAKAEELRSGLAAELHEKGSLDWSSGAGALLAARVMDGIGRAPEWLPSRRFAELFSERGTGSAASDAVTLDTVGEVGRVLLAERRMADLLGWLDGR